jgi:hypothetical protein
MAVNLIVVNPIATDLLNPMAADLLNPISMMIETKGVNTTISFSGQPPTRDIVQLLEVIDKVLSLFPQGNHVIKFDFEENTFIMSITFNSSKAVHAIQ